MEYTWLPSNVSTFYDTFDSIDSMLKQAQKEWDEKNGEFYYDNNSNNNSHIINIGEVENFNINDNLDSLVDDFIDRIEEMIGDFAFGTDTEGEVFFNDKKIFKEKYKDFIKKLINEDCSFYPSMKMKIYKEQYDLKEKTWKR